MGRSSRSRIAARVLPGVVAAWCLAGPPAVGVELFGPRLGLKSGSAPGHAVSADFNADGALDFAVANFDDNTVTVVLGDDLGGFEVLPPIDTDLVGRSISVAAGDFDLDGNADLVVADILGNSLALLFGDGEGTFSVEATLVVEGGPQFVAAGDFNLDGASDLVVAQSFLDSVTVLISDRGGGFTPGPQIPVGAYPHWISVGDLDRDGNEDLAIVNFFGDSVSVLIGDGEGGFEPRADVPLEQESAPGSAALGDFDSDGRLDLVVTQAATNKLTVLAGDGDGGFSLRQEIPEVGDSPVSVAAGDLDSDGLLDLVVTNLVSDNAAVLRGTPTGFQNTTLVPVHSAPRFVSLGEFTGDGALDALIVVATTDTLIVLPGDGLGGFAETKQITNLVLRPAPWQVGFWTSSVRTGDFNADGHADVAVSSLTSDSISVFLGDGQGNFDEEAKFETTVTAPASIAVEDFDGNGALDIVVGARQFSSGNGDIQVLMNDPDVGFAEPRTIAMPSRALRVETGDFNGDGASDIVATNRGDFRDNSMDGLVTVVLGDGEGGFGEAIEMKMLCRPNGIAADDFDGNGIVDLAVTLDRCDALVILPGNDDGRFFGATVRVESPTAVAGEYPARRVSVGPPLPSSGIRGSVELASDGVDVETDACEQLVNDFDGRIALVDQGAISDSDPLGGCTLATKVHHAQQAGASGVIVAGAEPGLPSNFIAFPDPDITIPAVGVSLADGDLLRSGLPGVEVSIATSNPAQARILSTGDFPFDVVSGHFNDDGHVDLAVANSGASNVDVFLGNGDGTFDTMPRVTVGGLPRKLSVADFNLDGLDDLAVALQGNSAVVALISDGQGGFSRTPEFHTGPRCIFVDSADFDEDGDPDVVAVNSDSDSVSLLFNQIEDRVDPNGSNRVDGLDLAGILRLSGVRSGEDAYRRIHDVDLNGVIDGDDLALVGVRFGELMRLSSPLRPALANPRPADPDTITLQEVASEGDLLTIELRVNDSNDPSTSAEFSVTFPADPSEGDPTPVLEAVGFDPGDYFSGGSGTQIYNVRTGTPDRVDVRVTRLPGADLLGAGQRLMSLKLRAKREGTAVLDFAPFGGRAEPRLLDTSGAEVAGIDFVGGVNVSVGAVDTTAVGQRIGFAPAILDFGNVPPGIVAKQRLRLSNFGYSDLRVLGVTSTQSDFVLFFTSSFAIPPYGSVELPVAFSPVRPGLRSAELIVVSDDPERPEARALVVGRSETGLAASSTHVDFGTVGVGTETTRNVGIGNRGNSPLVLSGVSVSHPDVVANVDFVLLNPGDFSRFALRYNPSKPGELHGSVTLRFGAADVVLVLTGASRAAP